MDPKLNLVKVWKALTKVGYKVALTGYEDWKVGSLELLYIQSLEWEAE